MTKRFEKLEKALFPENPLGSAPCHPLGKMVFFDPQREEEWNNLPENVKNFAKKHLEHCAETMTLQASITMICGVLNEAIDKIDALELRIKDLESKNG